MHKLGRKAFINVPLCYVQAKTNNMYQPRLINFKENVIIEDWIIKVYTITKDINLMELVNFEVIKTELPTWLNLKNSFNSDTYKIGFLIIHFGTEGVFSIINWWVGQNMLNSNVFFSNYSNPNIFKKISGDGLVACIWELEIIHYEKLSWTENILKKLPNPIFEKYIKDNFNTLL